MKIILSAFSAIIISTITIANANAQFSLSDSSHYYINPVTETVHKNREAKFNNDHSNRSDNRAAEHFHKEYPNAKNVNWYSLNGGYIAEFEDNSMQTKAIYDKKGGFNYSIKYYGEKSLPQEVWNSIKSAYYAYDIFKVAEVNVFDKTVYVVSVQNETEIKTIKVCEEEMEEMLSFQKG